MEFELKKLVRKNIQQLTPYSSARHEFTGEASVFLDANENAFGSPLPENYNRYPDPLQWKLKLQLSRLKNIPPENIFIGNGSDEVIDLAFRIFCEPGKDNVIICPPTYGMYEVSAQINNIAIKKIFLNPDFQLNVPGILDAVNPQTKIIFICSPNNPTGNKMNRPDIERLLNSFTGMVILDEAYIDFSTQASFINELKKYPNLIVLQTLSKAWGLAALRVGLGFASFEVIELFNKVKPPYNINLASQQLALDALGNNTGVTNWIQEIINQRNLLVKQLEHFPYVQNPFESDANFLLVKVNDATGLYQYLLTQKIITRNRSKEVLCENCIRITIGTPAENLLLLEALKNYNS